MPGLPNPVTEWAGDPVRGRLAAGGCIEVSSVVTRAVEVLAPSAFPSPLLAPDSIAGRDGLTAMG